MQSEEPDHLQRRRLALLRTIALVAPWIAAAGFALVSYGAHSTAPYAVEFPASARKLLTACLLGSGVLSILAWVLLRQPRRAPIRAGAMTACYVAALWVAVLGAAAWGRGAAAGWFAMTYVWALAVMYALLPLDGR